MDPTDLQIKKALVSLAIESSLLEVGVPVLEAVERTLHQNYRCYLPDCYEHPEYLKSVLQDLYGASHFNIIKAIHKNLEAFTNQKQIQEFLNGLSE